MSFLTNRQIEADALRRREEFDREQTNYSQECRLLAEALEPLVTLLESLPDWLVDARLHGASRVDLLNSAKGALAKAGRDTWVP